MKHLALVSLLILAIAGGSSAAEKLNVLLIISDDLRDTVGCYGNTQVKTPNLDGWLDLGKSWDEALMFRPTEAGKVIEGRNLTGGALKWCHWGATAGTDDDQPDGQTAQHSIATIKQQTRSGKSWFVGTGFHRPHDPFLSPKKYFDLYPPGSLKLYHDPQDSSPLPPLSISGGAFQEAFDAFTDTERMEFLRAYYAELYEELNDPEETHDVSNEPQHTKLIQKMKRLLAKVGPLKTDETQPPAKPKTRHTNSKT